MLLTDFVSKVQIGLILDEDGHGFYATEDRMSNKSIIPSTIIDGKTDKRYNHVVWFNR